MNRSFREAKLARASNTVKLGQPEEVAEAVWLSSSISGLGPK
jgi:hypothetical protein